MPANSEIITLTTDFGAGSPYVAALKGVILSINPAATLVDLTHAIPPQNIVRGALALADATRWFPPGSIHLAVVDPGVGTAREIVCARIAGRFYVAPDNGLLSLIELGDEPREMFAVERPEHWLPRVSHTFHGRDIMAPVAARLSLGLAPSEVGPPLADVVQLELAQPRVAHLEISGCVLYDDSFGNLITNIDAALLASIPRTAALRIICGGRTIDGLTNTYGDRPNGALLALIGSSGRLELAIRGGSAAQTLRVAAGDEVLVQW